MNGFVSVGYAYNESWSSDIYTKDVPPGGSSMRVINNNSKDHQSNHIFRIFDLTGAGVHTFCLYDLIGKKVFMKRETISEIPDAFAVAERLLPPSLMVAQLISYNGKCEKSEKVFIHK